MYRKIVNGKQSRGKTVDAFRDGKGLIAQQGHHTMRIHLVGKPIHEVPWEVFGPPFTFLYNLKAKSVAVNYMMYVRFVLEEPMDDSLTLQILRTIAGSIEGQVSFDPVYGFYAEWNGWRSGNYLSYEDCVKYSLAEYIQYLQRKVRDLDQLVDRLETYISNNTR